MGQNQSTKDPVQIPIEIIKRTKAKNLQEEFNGLVNESIWVNPTFKEEPKSNETFEEIGANKEV